MNNFVMVWNGIVFEFFSWQDLLCTFIIGTPGTILLIITSQIYCVAMGLMVNADISVYAISVLFN